MLPWYSMRFPSLIWANINNIEASVPAVSLQFSTCKNETFQLINLLIQIEPRTSESPEATSLFSSCNDCFTPGLQPKLDRDSSWPTWTAGEHLQEKGSLAAPGHFLKMAEDIVILSEGKAAAARSTWWSVHTGSWQNAWADVPQSHDQIGVPHYMSTRPFWRHFTKYSLCLMAIVEKKKSATV